MIPHFQTTDGALPRKPKRQHNAETNAHKQSVKRTVKYLGVCSSPAAYQSVLKGSSDEVIKAICNAALNVEQGDIRLSPAQRQLFSLHRNKIAKLTSHSGKISDKRKIIQNQKGGFPFIPILIGTALGALGGKLFGG